MKKDHDIEQGASEAASKRLEDSNRRIGERRRFFFLALIMICACAMVMTVMTVILYHYEMKKQREKLQVTAQSQARLIEAVARYDAKAANIIRSVSPDHKAAEATLSQIIDAHAHYIGFGKTGEFTLARREGDSIVFVLRHRHGAVEHPAPVAFNSDLAEPMRRALNGLSGTVIGLDYRGVTVLAAHEPVAVLDLGIVAKIDLSEIRAPFVRSCLAAAAISLIVILAGTALFFRIGAPILKRLEAYARDLEKEVEERKRTEETLRESETRLKGAEKIAKFGHWELTLGKDESPLYWSDEVYRIFGIDSSQQNVTHELFLNSVHPDDLDYLNTAYQESVKNKTQYSIDHRIVLPDGNIKYVHEQCDTYLDEKGNAHSLGTVQDITARKKVEEALEKERNLLRTLIDNIPDLIFIKDRESRFITGNTMVARYMGAASPNELIGKTDFEFYLREVAEQFFNDEQDIIRTGEPLINQEDPFSNPKTGHEGWYSTTKVPLKDSKGEVLGIVGITRDITKRKQAEAERERLLHAIEQSAECIVITDVNAVIQYVNPAFERITGYTYEEVIGKNPRILQSGKQDNAFYKKMWDTLTQGEAWSGHIINKRKDGTLCTLDATISPVFDSLGNIINYIAVMRDISGEIKLQEQLHQSQKLAEIGQLAGGIAHDFNNILMVIKGYSDFALQKLAAEDPIREDIDEIKSAGRRASALTRQLLAFSRKQILQPQTLNLNDLILNIDKMLRRMIGENIELITLPHPDLWYVKVDPGQIEQIIVNLSVNARDVMPDGGVLTIETANVHLDPTYAREHSDTQPGSYVMLAISDTGCGMDEETQQQIFEPFFTTKEKGKGTGLGLSTVYGIVKQSNGNIWVYSEPEKGTTFKIYFPRTSEPVETEKQEKTSLSSLSGSETILIVEDDKNVRSIIIRTLQMYGYTVLEASHGQEALQISKEYGQEIHLLLTDVIMPGMSGRTVAERMAPLFPSIKVLFMSGYTDNAIVHHGILDKGVELIQKPFVPAALAKRVRELLDRG